MGMAVQEGGPYRMLELPGDPQGALLSRQREVQRRLGLWDERISPRGQTYCLPGRVVHCLDCAVQEASEAWDMLEGGWKHHKQNPAEPSRHELVLELVDVMAYVMNAYLFMAGDSEQELVARLVGRSAGVKVVPIQMGLDYTWSFAGGEAMQREVMGVFYHGTGAHGPDWVKRTAGWVNALRTRLVTTASALRHGMIQVGPDGRRPEVFQPIPGAIYWELFPWVYGALKSVPGMGQAEYYSAHQHKLDIIFSRIDGGY